MFLFHKLDISTSYWKKKKKKQGLREHKCHWLVFPLCPWTVTCFDLSSRTGSVFSPVYSKAPEPVWFGKSKFLTHSLSNPDCVSVFGCWLQHFSSKTMTMLQLTLFHTCKMESSHACKYIINKTEFVWRKYTLQNSDFYILYSSLQELFATLGNISYALLYFYSGISSHWTFLKM